MDMVFNKISFYFLIINFMKKVFYHYLKWGVVLATVLGSQVGYAASLSDIDASLYKESIQKLYELGVVSGYPDGSFKPSASVNRAEFLKMVMGATGRSSGTGVNCFNDVRSEWFAKYVCVAKSAGLVQGYFSGDFRPSDQVNYVEALKMIYSSASDPVFYKADVSSWFTKYVNDASSNGIALSGVNFDSKLSRGQMAELIWRYLKVKNGGKVIVVSNGSSSSGSSGSVGPVGTTSLPTTGTLIYVATSGNDDSGNGSVDAPYKTIQKALEVAESGSNIIVRGGTYKQTTEVRIRKPNISIQSYPNELAVIDGSSLGGEDSAVNIDVDASGTKLLGMEIVGGFYAITTQTKWDWGDPNDRGGSSNIVIENNKIHASGRDAVKIKPNSNNIMIRHNEIYDTGKYQTPGSCNAEGIDIVNGDDVSIFNNYIHNTCSTGLYCKGGATRCDIENNVIKDVGEAGIMVGFDTSPEYFDLTQNPDYYENIDGVVRNNLIVNTKWAGIGLFASKNAVVENNTVFNAASDEHTPLYFGVTYQDWVAEAKRPANINPMVKNNIFVNSATSPKQLVYIRHSNDLGGLDALSGSANLNGNCYYSADGQPAKFFDGRSASFLDSVGFSSWVSGFKTDLNSVEGNPQLDGNYIPATSGVCAGKGYKQ